MTDSPTPKEAAALSMAVAVLPPGDAALELHVAGRGSVSARLAGHDDLGLLIAVPAGWVTDDIACTLTVLDARRVGFQVTVRVRDWKRGPDSHDVAHVAVQQVSRLKGRRSVPRGRVTESALVESGDAAFDVEVIDVGATGFGFITGESLAVGESITAMLNIHHSVARVTATVTNVTSIGMGRFRAGCQITRIGEADRLRLDALGQGTAAADRRGSGSEAADQLGLRSALVQRLAHQPSSPTPRDAAGERTLTALYCRPCARFTLHSKPRDGDQAWTCMNCAATQPNDTSPKQGDSQDRGSAS